jgi:hypothetical protein
MKAEVTDEAMARIEKTLVDLRSDDVSVRMAAQFEVKKLRVLFGSDALSAAEDTLAEKAWDQRQAEHDPSIVWD